MRSEVRRACDYSGPHTSLELSNLNSSVSKVKLFGTSSRNTDLDDKPVWSFGTACPLKSEKPRLSSQLGDGLLPNGAFRSRGT
jgi:hypothetical protein